MVPIRKPGLSNILLVSLGFILSPLSWWNDAVVNLPLTYLLALPFSLIDERFFLVAFILGYWLSNLLGFLMLYWGGEGFIYRSRATISVKHSVVVSVVYSFIVIFLVLVGWLAPPTKYLQ